MKILPLRADLNEYAKRRHIAKKLGKQIKLFKKNPFYPSLNTELLEPKKMRIWSFRVSGKYRALFIFRQNDVIEILDINNHYQ